MKYVCFKRFYRPSGSNNLIMVTAQREDGCLPCPRGVYGSTWGLKAPVCSAPCPTGTYSNKLAGNFKN